MVKTRATISKVNAVSADLDIGKSKHPSYYVCTYLGKHCTFESNLVSSHLYSFDQCLSKDGENPATSSALFSPCSAYQ